MDIKYLTEEHLKGFDNYKVCCWSVIFFLLGHLKYDASLPNNTIHKKKPIDIMFF